MDKRKTPTMSCKDVEVGIILLGLDGNNYKSVLDINNGRISKSWKITTEDITIIYEDEYDERSSNEYDKYRSFIKEKLIEYNKTNREISKEEKMKKASIEWNNLFLKSKSKKKTKS
jgi:hypothetical protein